MQTKPRFQPQFQGALPDAWACLPIFLREKQVREKIVAISHGALWEWVANRTFPPPLKLSSGVTAWKRNDLKEWADGKWVPEVVDLKEAN